MSVTARYLPSSDFLVSILNDDIALDETEFGQRNVRLLLSMVDDADRSNRDWAAFLIAGLPLDTPDIRAALLKAADDDDKDTRDEALVGVARRDPATAVARLRPLLSEDFSIVLLEVATILGDKNLIPALTEIRGRSGVSDLIREQLERALAACEAGLGDDDGWEARHYRLS